MPGPVLTTMPTLVVKAMSGGRIRMGARPPPEPGVEGEFVVVVEGVSDTTITGGPGIGRATSAVVCVAELFAGTTSRVVLVTVAVLVIVALAGVLRLTRTVTWKTAEAPGARLAVVAVRVPVPPAAGVARLNPGPAVCCAATNVVPAGTTSVSRTPSAGLGPALVTVMV